MSKNLYSDFAVLTAAGRTVNFEEIAEDLRIIPFFNEISLVDAMKGNINIGYDLWNGGSGFVPKDAMGWDVTNVTIQHQSDGYVRLVGNLAKPFNFDPNYDTTIAKGFAVVSLQDETQDPSDGSFRVSPENLQVCAVASLKKGYDIGESSHVAFTVTTLNNYKSVSFNPNAFATLEDLAEINGLDGLHIAFDSASGDIKLLDKEGKVLDQANLHMDADTIIAEGEEGYKYVKTDIDQDIHAVKAFMPEGKSAFGDVEAQEYEVQHAALLVDLSDAASDLALAINELSEASGRVATAQQNLDDFRSDNPDPDPEAIAQLEGILSDALSDLRDKEDARDEALANYNAASDEARQAVRHGDYTDVKGIRYVNDNGVSTDYEIGGEYNNSKVGATREPFLVRADDLDGCTLVYSPDAFVWTVGSDVGDVDQEGNNFAQQMNANAQALGFHIGDDIPLGTNLPDLIASMGDGDFDAEAYMHGGEDGDYTDLVDEQRNLAKEELVAWNAQHPALEHDGLNGTLIGDEGVAIRNGMLSIGNGYSADGHDYPKQYILSTNFSSEGENEGLSIGVLDSSDGTNHNVVTITKDDYISGAPICMILAQFITEDENREPVQDVKVRRKTANFSVSVPEVLGEGTFSLTINDTRPSSRDSMGNFDTDRIVEIVPVYKPGADDSEAVPALRPIHAIGTVEGGSLTVQCSQVLDWAASLGLGESAVGDPTAKLYLIIKVY